MIKYLTGLMATLVLAACSTAPAIIPDTTKDNVVMQRLQWEIQTGKTLSSSWSWVLWYLPVVFLVVVWAYKEWLKTQCKEDEKKQKTDK
jgi:hypothetical protein